MKNMKKMTALACAAMMMASMGITGCAKADGQTKEETKAVVVETPTGTETSATTENEATMLPGGETRRAQERRQRVNTLRLSAPLFPWKTVSLR